MAFPPVIAAVFIPHLAEVYRQVGSRLTFAVIGSGLVAGWSGILYGLGISKLGLAGANALANGLSMAIGSFLPLVLQHANVLRTRLGAGFIVGLSLALSGVFVSAYASHVRSRIRSKEGPSAAGYAGFSPRNAWIGIAVSIAAGLLFPLQNLGIAFAGDFMKTARSLGANEAFMTYAYYVPYFGASFVGNGIYCAVMWRRKGTLREWGFEETRRYLGWILVMAVAWTVAMLTYGWAMPYMRGYGPVVGWPVTMATGNLAAATVEYLYGDWRGRPLGILAVGLLLLTMAIGTFGFCNAYLQGILR